MQREQIILDREWQASKAIPFSYLTIATGTTLAPPAAIHYDDKPSGIEYLTKHSQAVGRARSVLIIGGGGAVGVQLATDIEERNPQMNGISQDLGVEATVLMSKHSHADGLLSRHSLHAQLAHLLQTSPLNYPHWGKRDWSL